MVYRKRGYKKGGYAKKRRGRPNIKQVSQYRVAGMTVPQMARYGAMGYNVLKGLINSELKRFDIQASGTVSTTPALTQLTGMTQGDDVGNRNGNKILAKYLKFEAILALDPTAAASFVRVMIFVDTENQGSTPLATDVLQDSTSSNGLVSRVNVDNTQRFTVLCDKTYSFCNSGTQNAKMKCFKPLNFHINYTSASATSQNKNSIWLMLLSDETSATPSIVWTSRLAFYDN